MIVMLRKNFFVLVAVLSALLAARSALAEFEVKLPAVVAVGAPFFLKVYGPQGFTGVHLRWQNKQVHVPAIDGEAALLLGAPLETAAGVHPVVGELEVDGLRRAFVREVTVQGRVFPEQRLRVASRMVSPDPAVMPRIEEERRLVRQVLERVTDRRYWDEPFVRPVGGLVSSTFGLRRFFNDQPRAPHRGVDLRGAEGTPVLAFSAGRVALAGDHYFAGKSVYIDHGLGMVTQYIHLSEISVTPGQAVSAGQVIGKVGATGRVTGPHLHFGLSVLGMWVDPLPLLEVTKE